MERNEGHKEAEELHSTTAKEKKKAMNGVLGLSKEERKENRTYEKKSQGGQGKNKKSYSEAVCGW